MVKVNIDTIAGYPGGPANQVYWFGPRLGGRPLLCYSRQMNRVNSCTGCDDDCTINTVMPVTVSIINYNYHLQ